MKVNEAPEKIYLQQYDEDTLICLNKYNIHEEWTEEITNEKIAENIEYTRTDAFIEKACKYLMDYEFNDSPTIADRRKRVEDFKNYIKGE